MDKKVRIALAGNPNTGKSTVFNALTGLKQHTGNWSGKTVGNTVGYFSLDNQEVALYDLPGIYSLFSDRAEECSAKEFICFGDAAVSIVILDATSLERNLPLGLQVMEIAQQVVFCLNLTDEAEKKGISIDKEKLEEMTGVPVIAMAAREGKGLEELKTVLGEIGKGKRKTEPRKTDFFGNFIQTRAYLQESFAHLLEGRGDLFYSFFLEEDACILEKTREAYGWDIVECTEAYLRIASAQKLLRQEGGTIESHRELRSLAFLARAKEIAAAVMQKEGKSGGKTTERIDRIMLAKRTGIPIMLLLLGLVFWITVAGANVPSDFLMRCFQNFGNTLHAGLTALATPPWLQSLLLDGMYLTVSWVVAVMLPPMAIFFPLFTLLEDFGLLPRIAFNLDGLFQKAGAHGKQALTMGLEKFRRAIGKNGWELFVILSHCPIVPFCVRC